MFLKKIANNFIAAIERIGHTKLIFVTNSYLHQFRDKTRVAED